MISSLPDYIEFLKRAIYNKNGDEVAKLLSLEIFELPNIDRLLQKGPLRQRNVQLPSHWDQLIDSHLKVLELLKKGDFQGAFNEKLSSINDLTKLLTSQREENWCIALMHKYSVDLRKLATESSKALTGQTQSSDISATHKPDENLEKAADSLMGLFRICATDLRSSTGNSKRIGMIIIINQLFKIYFKINKLHLCKPLIKALDNANIFNQFSIAQQVTYNYYLGIKSLFDSNVMKAESLLEFVFKNCHPQMYKHKRLTLIFLIPVKMLMGHMPSEDLMNHYKLPQFKSVKQAVINGRVGDLDDALEINYDFFWKYGIYLIVEKLRNLTYRNIFKKVTLVLKTHTIPIEAFCAAIRIVQNQQDVSTEEVHCILANLIYDGKIKGYISLNHQKMVVSKVNPFPPLAELTANREV